MMKRLGMLVLTTVFLFCLLPVSALAYGSVEVNGLSLYDGDYLETGSHTTTQTKPGSDSYAHFKDGVLTLHDFMGKKIFASGESVTIRLEGENVLDSDEDEDAIAISQSDVIIEGTGSLTANAYYASAIDLNEDVSLEIKSGTLDLFSFETDVIEADDYCSITISGTAAVNVICLQDIQVGDGIDLDEFCTLHVKGGMLSITATDHGIELDGGYSTPGVIIDGGVISINADDDAIDSENGVIVNGGTLNLTAEDNGIDAESGDITINGGDITIVARNRYGISAGYEEEAHHHNVVINGGTLDITADVFGIHAGGNIVINEGSGTVHAADLAVAAYGSLVGDSFTNKSRVQAANANGDVYEYETVTSEAGLPLHTFTFSAVSGYSHPHTGDHTPLALLALMMALSLSGMLIARRRKA